ncbi:efflux RND transporter periplasmic adaptor subunit [Candidatus Methylomicrobium oryzae]|jgi:cobalt-zinc-cadmium efflux system membrane fusion protein|uniref:efflux RND transporter periplasmic adaptor subunit n=1 Tax=Candidatus Methylomicrobium oryzae TaxID=2802053 RepID=UPI001920BE2C|nr:efflux RND transporter periplasmic adaptor subunit [Methylomicrobium sp. RS1]MBL1262982.1 efflux RND transporter periplasmic adaptor subunit [Methylomicrobium sp. RS1]
MTHPFLPRFGRRVFFYGGCIIVAVAFLLMMASGHPGHAGQNAPDNTAVVKLAGPRTVAVRAGSLLEQKLDISTVPKDQITTPLLLATGSVVAHLAPGSNPSEDRWQFNSIELSGVYADWQRARAEKEFNIKRLEKIRQLTAAQTHSQKLVVDRLRKLVATGTEAIRDLTAAEANLLQVQLEGQKAVYEAETALTVATRNRAALERTLLQDGVDPSLLENATSGTSLIKADVPELKINLVSVGQACVTKFYGLPGQSFIGKVKSLAPALSAEQHTLRVFFELPDPDNKFKPGMYAEIGLGTDPRMAILVPSDAILHSRNADFVFIGDGPERWKITEVLVGESIGDRVEILQGLKGGEKIIGNGAILLKPMLVQALLNEDIAREMQPEGVKE